MSTPTDAPTGMHDKCKAVVIFHNNLSKFFRSLKGTLPEYSETIRTCIEYYKTQPRCSYIAEVQTLMTPHIKYISQYDDGVFTDDYQPGPRYLLPKMDFRTIWDLLDGDDFAGDEELQCNTKKAIFNHVQSIYVSVQMASDQISLFDKNIEKQKVFLMDMLENLQLDDTIKKRIEEMRAEEAATTGMDDKGALCMDKIASLFGEDNFVYQLAKDVANELELGNEDISNPVEAITALFSDNGRKLKSLIVSIGDKIEQKVQSGEIDKEKLISDAKVLKDKMKGLVPGLDHLLNNQCPYQDLYDGLSDELKSQYSNIPDLLSKDASLWSDSERASFSEFMQCIGDGSDSEDSKPASKPKPRAKAKSKGKPRASKPKHR